MFQRYALVSLRRDTPEQVEPYLYSNYEVIGEVDLDDGTIERVGPHNALEGRYLVIAGRDSAGFSLESQRDRLSSGIIASFEIDLSHPVMKRVP